MKAVILAGGMGTRLSEETNLKPKPMIEIGGKPIIWHIMKIYSFYGVNDFIICCGYKGYLIKEYFANYFLHTSDVTFDIAKNEMEVHQNQSEPWKVTLVDTGLNTMTGGRIKKIKNFIENDEFFSLTYGDGVGNININDLINFHIEHGKEATVTATRPPGRYGALVFDEDKKSINHFEEKPIGDNSWINGGFFILSPKVLNRISDEECIWEHEPLTGLAKDNQLQAYKHNGFWQPMDTVREKNYLNSLWQSNQAPWKVW